MSPDLPHKPHPAGSDGDLRSCFAHGLETGASEKELEATVEEQELEIAFNVKFLQDGLEAITTKNVTIEANAHNTPAVLHSIGDEENLYVLIPMHIDGR